MHRWSFQRLFRWLIPTFVFLVSLCALVIEQKASKAGLSFAADSAYVDIGVGRALAEEGVYALDPSQKMPAVRDALWRGALAAAGLLTRNYVTGSYLLGATFSLVTLLLCLRLARLLFPFPPFILFSSILLIVAPRLLADAVDGTSASLATALVTAACLLHVEGLSERRQPLPISAALLVALLMWIRVEFVLVWVVLLLHAVVLAAFRRGGGESILFVITRGLTGLLLMALCLLPLLAWNLQVIRVPWPQTVGAPLTLDSWAAASPPEVAKAYLALAAKGVSASFARLHQTPFLAGIVERILAWFGVLFIVGLSLWRREEQPYTVMLFLLLLLPPLYALLYPLLGWQSASLVFGTLGPLCIVAASFGIFRIPFLLENLYRKWRPGIPQAPGFGTWWVVAGSVLLIVSLVRGGGVLHRRTADLVSREAARQAVSAAIKSGQVGAAKVATDAPGWVGFTYSVGVVDLTGECSPEVLACLSEKGQIDPAELSALLAERKPDTLILWDRQYDFVSSAVPCQPVALPDGDRPGAPRVYMLNWSGVF